MKATTVLGFGLIGLALLVLLTVVLVGRWIEDDLASRSQEELEAVGQSWVSVDMSGRDAILTGTVPEGEDNAAITQHALDAVAGVWGVRAVHDEITRP